MELSFKKLSIAAMALGLAGTAGAAGYAPPEPAPAPMSIPVTIPVTVSAWDIGIQALWLRAGTADLLHGFKFVDNSTGSISSEHFEFFETDPSFEWGFRLEGSYHFAGSGKDINLNWTRVHSSETNNVDISGVHPIFALNGIGATEFTTYREFGLFGAGFDVKSSRTELDFDAVNLEFAQHIDVGQDLDIRVHAGAQYAKVEFTQHTISSTPEAFVRFFDTGEDSLLVARSVDSVVDVESFRSKTDGLGPRFGFDASLDIANGFSAVASGAVALLYSKRKADLLVSTVASISSISENDNFEDYTIEEFISGRVDSNKMILPSIDASLGLRYVYDMGDDSSVSVEGGWKHQYYNDAVRRSATSAAAFSLGGPYLGLKYVG